MSDKDKAVETAGKICDMLREYFGITDYYKPWTPELDKLSRQLDCLPIPIAALIRATMTPGMLYVCKECGSVISGDEVVEDGAGYAAHMIRPVAIETGETNAPEQCGEAVLLQPWIQDHAMTPGVEEKPGEWPQWIRDAASEIMGPEWSDVELRRESHRTKLNIEQLKASRDREWAAIADVIKKHSPPAPEWPWDDDKVSELVASLIPEGVKGITVHQDSGDRYHSLDDIGDHLDSVIRPAVLNAHQAQKRKK